MVQTIVVWTDRNDCFSNQAEKQFAAAAGGEMVNQSESRSTSPLRLKAKAD